MLRQFSGVNPDQSGGHVLGCQQKDASERRYYSCQGRYKDAHLDGSPKCTLPRIKADELEKAVWKRLKTVMTDHEALRESLRSTLEDLKQKRNGLSKGSEFNEKELQTVYDKKERLALVFADQAITKEVYGKRMSILKKKESELLKARTNLDPKVKIELDDLERGIASLERAIEGKSGKLFLTELSVSVDSIPDDWIVGRIIQSADSWNDSDALINTRAFQVGEYGPLMTMVDGPVQYVGLEVPPGNRVAQYKKYLRVVRHQGLCIP